MVSIPLAAIVAATLLIGFLIGFVAGGVTAVRGHDNQIEELRAKLAKRS